MVKRVNEEGFMDKLRDTHDRAKIAKDYLMGNRTSSYKFQDATDDEIKSNTTLSKLTKIFDKSKAGYHVKIDLKANKLQMTFDATKVPTEVVDDFKSGGKYDKYVNSYNQESHEVEMIFDVEKNVPTRGDTEKAEDESVMAPTPTPYKYKPAKAPKESDDLIINEYLEMSPVEPYHDDATGDIGLTTEINGRRYNFRMKDDSPYSVDQMFSKVSKMMGFSKGKALAFLKKHAVGTRHTESKLREGNPFKSSFICQGCGKPLDQCTCEIDLSEIEDEDDETQSESCDPDEWYDEVCKSLRAGDYTPEQSEPDLSEVIGSPSDPQTEGVLVPKKPYKTPVISLTESLVTIGMLQKRADERRQMTDEEYDEWIEMMKDALNTPTEESLSEDLTHNEDDILSVAVEKFGTTNTPYQGPTFILPNGLFLNLKGRSHHSEVEKFLVDNGYSEGPYGLTTGSPTLKKLGCIRCDTAKYYVALSEEGPTREQYNTLLVWLDYLSRFTKVVEVAAPGVRPQTYPLESEVDSDEVVDRVRKYYAFGSLNEELSRHGLYIRQPIGEAFNAATATQPSSVGQHKKGSIDMIIIENEESEERSHPDVGRKIWINNPDIKLPGGSRTAVVSRAYDDSRGTSVRIDDGNTTITLNPGEYRFLSERGENDD